MGTIDYFRKEEKKSPIIIVPLGFDARDELDRAIKFAELTMIKPSFRNNILPAEEEARLVQQELSRAQTQVEVVREQYLRRLNAAKEAGVVDSQDYSRALMDASSFGRFDDLKRKLRRDYLNI